MRIEAGKWYVKRDGRRAFVLQKGMEQDYPWEGVSFGEDGGFDCETWTKDGSVCNTKPTNDDLIRPATPAEIAAVTGEAPEAEQKETPPVLDWEKPIQTEKGEPAEYVRRVNTCSELSRLVIIAQEGCDYVYFAADDGYTNFGFRLVNVPEEPPEPRYVWVTEFDNGETRVHSHTTTYDACSQGRTCRSRVPLITGRFDD